MPYFSKTFLIAIGMLAASCYADAQALEHPEKGDKNGPPPHARKMFQENDTDKDGYLSKQEFMTHVERQFAEMDSNNDGKLTEDEMHAFHKARRDARGGDSRRTKGANRRRDRDFE